MTSGFLGNAATLLEENTILSLQNNGGTLTTAQNELVGVLGIKQTLFITLALVAVVTTLFNLCRTYWYISSYKKWADRENLIAKSNKPG